jgi:hypothetical protein
MVNTHNNKINSPATHCLTSFLVIAVTLFGTIYSANAEFVPFETTRIKSTAGTGVASLLMDEASSLNPASLGFFTMSSLYVQKTKENFSRYSEGSTNPAVDESELTGVIISDAKGRIKGSFSYHRQYDQMDSRQQYGLSLSTAGGEQSAMGVTYLFTKDRLHEIDNSFHDEEFYQLVFGITHALNRSFTIGTVVIDPTKKRVGETRAIVGVQYTFRNFLFLMADLGSDYNQALSETVLYRAAAQFKIFSDFYLRFGASNDRGKRLKSSGVGIGWVQPRLVVNLSIKNSNRDKSLAINQEREDLKESSFSLSYHF